MAANAKFERLSLAQIAAAGDTTNTSVRKIAGYAALPYTRGERRSIPRKVADLLIVSLRGKVMNFPTARMLGTNPAAVLEGAEALAELARMAMADRARSKTDAAA